MTSRSVIRLHRLPPRARRALGATLGGVASTAVDLAVLTTMVAVLGASIPLAAFLGATSGAALCFLINRRVFGDRRPLALATVARFAAVALGTAVLMALAMELVAVRLAVPYLLAKVVCAAVIFVVWSYPAQRRLVFAAV
jgi:putative flippase GtrA